MGPTAGRWLRPTALEANLSQRYKIPSLDENHLYGTRVPSLYVYINISIQKLRHRRNDIFNKVLC